MLTEMCFETEDFCTNLINYIDPRWRVEFIQITFQPGKETFFGFSNQTSTLDYLLFEGCSVLDGFIFCSLNSDSNLNGYITVDVEICLWPTGYSKLLL